jgi:hypothetical protein
MREEVWGEYLWEGMEEWEWGGGWGKSEGIKRGALPYVPTSSFPAPTIMILQTITRFSYFYFFINMLKWWSSIWRFIHTLNIF